ncbi:MAG: hypothetical protein KGL53_16645, partial [Elusimicrobia bacterium]|nr:hypothetical protein [Elusimicrobiota bacterium]
RAGRSFVWAPHARGWEPKLLARVASDLGLLLASDPLHGPLPTGRVRYLRAAGRVQGNRLQREVSFSNSELRRLLEAASGASTWAFLGNRDCWRDAGRLEEMSLRCAA